MKRHRNVRNFMFLDPGGIIKVPKALIDLFKKGGFDIAAYVHRIGPTPPPGPFDGIGRVSLSTILIRRTREAERVLTRWMERNALRREAEAENLLFTLSEMRDVTFLHLPPEYCWVESSMRAFHIAARPVIEHCQNGHVVREFAVPVNEEKKIQSSEVLKKETTRSPEVLWVGHLYQYTGYGKANREILFRVANTFNVRIDDTYREPCCVSESIRVRLDAHKQILVGPHAPLLRFMGPDHIESKGRYRIVWTMMETSCRVHPDMIARANDNFDELWTPTEWNLQVFRDSGLRLPARVMPLGVDTIIFRPWRRKPLPLCKLISTSRRGLLASPSGFIALTVGLPGFRKGWDVIADAFESVFAGLKDAHFVIGLTHSPAAWSEKVYKQFANYRSNIWTLEGSFDEFSLAQIYSGVDVYVSASRGEGFNLPALEAAACGVPIILPYNTAHPEIFGDDAFYFPAEGVQKYPEGDWISPWYPGMLFSRFGKKSINVLAELLTVIRERKERVDTRIHSLRRRIVERLTWDAAAARVSERLLQVQP
jgi:glycosyltransferase involved in cell wall biosynthesis